MDIEIREDNKFFRKLFLRRFFKSGIVTVANSPRLDVHCLKLFKWQETITGNR